MTSVEEEMKMAMAIRKKIYRGKGNKIGSMTNGQWSMVNGHGPVTMDLSLKTLFLTYSGGYL